MSSENRNKDMPDRIQLRCPKCGEEFAFNRGKLEEERSILVIQLQEALAHLTEIKKLPKSAHSDKTWRERTHWKRVSNQLNMRLSEIKTLLKQVSGPVTSDLFSLYRERMKDLYGEEADESVMKWAKQNLEAYKVSSLSAHEYYTHKGGKIIQHI